MEDMEVEAHPPERPSSESKEVYLPGQPLPDGEELVCDESAYILLHQAQTGHPCLSFDIIKDNLGDNRDTYPLTTFLVSGTQASQSHLNSIIVMRLSNLHKTYKENSNDDEEDEDDSDDDDESTEKQPKMSGALMKHQGCVNRIRAKTIDDSVLAATWSELGRVSIWDMSKQLQAVNNDELLNNYNKNEANNCKPLFTFLGHQQEGFAIDWSPTKEGTLATGDCKKNIHLWTPSPGGSWMVDQTPLKGHESSVEDLQWSPNEACVLASCSVDKTIRVWDTRAPANAACMITCKSAHDSDVNVIHWNRNEPFIVSGGDDGMVKIWDLRRFQQGSPVAIFKHHTAPITSVEWHPTDGAVFASSGADDQIALWDLSVEKDDESEAEISGLPPQLLFIHQGQTELKELHWHQQIPGLIISTAQSGFNIFRTISV